MMEEVNSVSLWYKGGGLGWSACSVAQSCLILRGPLDGSPPGSSVHEIVFRQEHWSGLPFPSPGDLPDPRIKSACPVSPELWILSPAEPSGKPWVDLDTVERKES